MCGANPCSDLFSKCFPLCYLSRDKKEEGDTSPSGGPGFGGGGGVGPERENAKH